ncbi:hypothetical protein EYC84_001093 [Monilinia fructicola]|uniref:Uncharacterized protein n=1 Tax=Monilinia fructicola TaxID=38448 RepID=A0A5M9JNU3_MONFR|nr:hypothetical protein EYC84_001093 [Monilinia fructicola]
MAIARKSNTAPRRRPNRASPSCVTQAPRKPSLQPAARDPMRWACERTGTGTAHYREEKAVHRLICQAGESFPGYNWTGVENGTCTKSKHGLRTRFSEKTRSTHVMRGRKRDSSPDTVRHSAFANGLSSHCNSSAFSEPTSVFKAPRERKS